MAKTYDKVRYIETSGFNPHYNLALESALMDAAKDGELIVYLSTTKVISISRS